MKVEAWSQHDRDAEDTRQRCGPWGDVDAAGTGRGPARRSGCYAGPKPREPAQLLGQDLRERADVCRQERLGDLLTPARGRVAMRLDHQRRDRADAVPSLPTQ